MTQFREITSAIATLTIDFILTTTEIKVIHRNWKFIAQTNIFFTFAFEYTGNKSKFCVIVLLT